MAVSMDAVDLVPMTHTYSSMVREWFDDPGVRKPNLIPDEISGAEFLDRLASVACELYIIMAEGYPVGIISLIRQEDGFFQVPVTIADRHYRGRGVGSEALRKVAEIHSDKDLVQKIRLDNHRMIAISRKCGFNDVGVEGDFLRLEKRSWLSGLRQQG